MFILFLIQGSLVLLVFSASSRALPSPLELISSPLKLPASLKTRALNTTSVQDIEVPILSYRAYCNPSYGRNLNPTSCDNALAKISEVTTPLTFGQRGTGNYDVVLPHRYLSDDGQCAIDIKVDPNGMQHDVSNDLEITNAASAVRRDCVGSQYGSLSVGMSRYSPSVECLNDLRAPPPLYDSCKEVIDTMQWSETSVKFGYPWQSDSTESLLQAWSGSQTATLHHLRPSPVETASWASIWSEIVAVNEMCVKNGKAGDGKPSTFHGTLTVIIFGRGVNPPPEILSGLNLSTSDLSMLSASNTSSPVTDS
ncbi:hypothetical protein BDR22DRAFT_892189 [Usnea florida]